MKYIVIVADGMSGYPLEELGGKTTMEASRKPYMDALSQKGVIGLMQTVPDGLPVGSEVANLALMGYDPEYYYSGRSPLEAASIGVNMLDTDVAYRMNLVTLSDAEKYEDKVMLDYSADEITTEEARVLVEYLKPYLETPEISIYAGISYRHCLIWHDGEREKNLTQPHDIYGRVIGKYLMREGIGAKITDMMERSYDLLKDHPINKERVKRGLNPANSVWFWGGGTKTKLYPFEEEYGVKGAVISAVDLIKGLAICAGLKSIDVEGATGTVHTNFEGKAKAAIDALLSGYDFIYVHVEGPDESGHHGSIEDKIKSIEMIDQKILGPIVETMRKKGIPFSVMLSPDHATPIVKRTHARDPVPFFIYRSTRERGPGVYEYSERGAARTGIFIDNGYTLIHKFLNNETIR